MSVRVARAKKSFKCLNRGPLLIASDEFTSHTTSRVYKMKIAASFKSSNINYLITSRRCGQQYVGKTERPLHRRATAIVLASHMGGLRNLLCGRPLNERWTNSCKNDHHGDRPINSRNSCLHNIWESRWIRTLGSLQPQPLPEWWRMQLDVGWKFFVLVHLLA